MATMLTTAKAEGIGIAIKSLTGEYPMIEYTPNGARVILSPLHQKYIENKIENAIKGNTPKGEIEFVGLSKPLTRPVIKRAIPIAIGLLLTGFVVGKLV